MTGPSTTPAGWYDDGSGTGTLRYWDGNAWTDHTAPAQPAANAGPTGAEPTGPTTPVVGQPPAAGATVAYGESPAYPVGAQPGTSAPDPNRKPHVLGFIALAVAVLGFIFACIPGALIVGWVLLPIAFVLAIIALFMKGAKWPAITGLIVSVVGTVVGFVVFVGVVSASIDAADDPVAPTAAASEEAAAPSAPAEEPTTAPTPEAAADLGTVTNPFPQPYVAKGLLGGEKYSLTASITADGQDVTVYNMFNDPAPAGFKYVIVQATMTGIDPDGVEPSLASFDLTLATPEGNQYNSETIVFGDGMPSMWDGPTLYPGSAFTGYLAFVVPEGATGFMLHDNGNYIAL